MINIRINNLNEIYKHNFHDADIIKFEYSFKDEIARINIIALDTEIEQLIFGNVISVELNLTKPWVCGGNIVGVYVSRNIDQVYKMATKLSDFDPNNDSIAYTQDIKEFFITKVEINSGDNVIILAKSIILQ